MYLYSAMADLAYETGENSLLQALQSLHDSVTLRRMYVTGGIGPSEHNEGFTADYDLPNDNAYQETCASQGMILWNYRMLKLTGDSRYADVMELSLLVLGHLREQIISAYVGRRSRRWWRRRAGDGS
jgi:hypothetical protein